MTRRRWAAVALVACLGGMGVGKAASAHAGPPSSGSGGNARIEGTFSMRGLITVAVNVSGERAGQTVSRTWVMSSDGCHASVCALVVLRRTRGTVSNSRLTLQRIAPGEYRGSAAFWVSLECLGRDYRLGSLAPYSITLEVTRRRRVGSVWYATAVQASYVNASRSDATPCPLGPVTEKASYTGSLESRLPAPPKRRTKTTPTGTTTTPYPIASSG